LTDALEDAVTDRLADVGVKLHAGRSLRALLAADRPET
jgi:hypothetical protein